MADAVFSGGIVSCALVGDYLVWLHDTPFTDRMMFGNSQN